MNKKIFLIISVILISLLFVMSGYNKITNFNGNVTGLHSKMLFNNLPLILSQMAMIIAIILEFISPVLILYGIIKDDKRFVMAGASGLILFTVLATIFYHPLPQDITGVLKNTSIVGGLLYLLLK